MSYEKLQTKQMFYCTVLEVDPSVLSRSNTSLRSFFLSVKLERKIKGFLQTASKF